MEYELKKQKEYNAEEDWLEFCEYLISKTRREKTTNKLCENSTDIPYITDEEEVHNKYDKGYKYLLSSAFYLETSRKEDMEKRLIKLTKSLTYADKDSIEEFKRWTENVFKLSGSAKKIIEEKFNEEEDVKMSNIPRILDEIHEDGIAEGIAKGRERWISSIKRMLIKKLNELPSKEVSYKLEKMTIEELENIGDKIFEIESWEEV